MDMLDLSTIKYDKDGLVPAVAQEHETGEVLMLAYMTREALEKTLSTKRAHYWSRSRGSLWMKGETSGNFQDVKAVYYDCDMDAVLVMVSQKGPACHTGERTCFFRRLDGSAERAEKWPAVMARLFKTLKHRKGASPETSYTASLYSKGRGAILEKVAEESRELVEATGKGKRNEIIHEAADLWFHTLVLLANEDIEAEELYLELERRTGVSGIEEKKSRNKGG